MIQNKILRWRMEDMVLGKRHGKPSDLSDISIQDVPPSYHHMPMDFVPGFPSHLPSFSTCTSFANPTHLAAILLPHPHINAGHFLMHSANFFVDVKPLAVFKPFLHLCSVFGTGSWMYELFCFPPSAPFCSMLFSYAVTV